MQVEEFVEARRAELDDPSTADRDVVRVALASGMAMLARLTGRPELLPAALHELQHSRHAVHVAWVINALLDVVPPITAAAGESGRGELLEEAVDLLAEVTAAASTALPAAQIMLRSARAEGLLVLRAIAEDADDEPRALRLQDAAIDELQRALELTRRGSRVRAFCTIELAAASWNRPAGDGIDGAIRACRRSLRRLRLRWRPSRAAWWELGP